MDVKHTVDPDEIMHPWTAVQFALVAIARALGRSSPCTTAGAVLLAAALCLGLAASILVFTRSPSREAGLR